MYYFPSLKVHSHAKVPGTALAVPVPQEEGVAVGWCLPGCSAQPCPAPRAQLWGRAGFGGMPAAASAITQCWSVRFGVSCLPLGEAPQQTLWGCCSWLSSSQNCPQEPRMFVLLSAHLVADQALPTDRFSGFGGF